MKNKEIAEYLQQKLLNLGFIIHRYDAYSTCSIYLKLDYGACNTIRISDHKGYDHCKADKENIDNLISIILEDRQFKKCFNDYDKLIQNFKLDSRDSKGFWEGCVEVKL